MSVTRAEQLLGCALTFREASIRDSPIGTEFSECEDAIATFVEVLMHEAHEAMQSPLSLPPEHPYMHPVDVDTDEPGIVFQRENLQIHRCKPSIPRVKYTRNITGKEQPITPSFVAKTPPPKIVAPTPEKARLLAQRDLSKAIAKEEKRAAVAEERSAAARERKEQRARETNEEKQQRLADARAKREERKRKKEEEEANGLMKDQSETKRTRTRKPPTPPSDDSIIVTDTSNHIITSRKRIPGGKLDFYSHPLPHHRHLEALQLTQPNERLIPALLRGRTVEELQIIQGPPGTGKTTELIRRLTEDIQKELRVYLCAPTNVAAANLYMRCLAAGMSKDASLALAPDRVPLGTVVESNDPARRIVCSTISSRAGPMLHAHSFDVVMVDEAAQCMEAWIWGLLRKEVTTLVMAGDVHQLPARASESGVLLKHERSLMERLMSCGYENTTHLTVQNRMCPQLLHFPNESFFGGTLIAGPGAPAKGKLHVVHLEDGAEEESGTSIRNKVEAEHVARVANEMATDLGPENVKIIAPYAAQVSLLLAQKTGLEIHTIDSFQGRESEGIVLSCVRDGRRGIGFWSDERRIAVALTRAKRRLTVVVSNPSGWPPSSRIAQLSDRI